VFVASLFGPPCWFFGKIFMFIGFLFLKGFVGFQLFLFFYKALLDIAYLWCRQYIRNLTAALTTHALIKLLIQSN